jgi:hypothetical protein
VVHAHGALEPVLGRQPLRNRHHLDVTKPHRTSESITRDPPAKGGH